MTATLMNPTDLRGVRDAVLDSAGTLAVAGAGTAAGWAGALGPVDAVLDLRALTGVITHNPGDMTVSVRAGTRHTTCAPRRPSTRAFRIHSPIARPYGGFIQQVPFHRRRNPFCAREK